MKLSWHGDAFRILSLYEGNPPVNGNISIESQILWILPKLQIKTECSDENESIHIPRQLNCRSMCKIVLGSEEYQKKR